MPKTFTQKCSEGNTETSEQNLRNRSYCFTSYEPINKKLPLIDILRYCCYSPEICPTTGRHHWQGYIYLKDTKTISAIQKRFMKEGWTFGKLIVASGTADENRIYCGFADYFKDGKMKEKNPNFFEWGDKPEQGKRCDLIELKNEMIKGTKLVADIILDDPMIYHQYGRTLEKLETVILNQKFRTWMTEGLWYYGKTGIGKSHIAFENYNPKTHYIWNFKDSGFWQNYKGQETVIINEIREEVPFNEMLDIVDKWPKNLKIKGGDTVPLLAKKVIVTSAKHPKAIYYKSLRDGDNFDQLERRFKIIRLGDPIEEDESDVDSTV